MTNLKKMLLSFVIKNMPFIFFCKMKLCEYVKRIQLLRQTVWIAVELCYYIVICFSPWLELERNDD